MKNSFLLFISLFNTQLFATHNYAGEIKVEQISARTIKATIVTYTLKVSNPADRSQLTMNWGDQKTEIVQRSQEEPFDDTFFKKNYYTQEHTYDVGGTYTVSMTDPNRNGGILNVNYPMSDAIAFHIQTTITLVSQTAQQKYNSTPSLNVPPMDGGYVGRIFEYKPDAIDAEGDSVAYRLITPLAGLNTSISKYDLPDKVAPSDSNTVSFSEKTGLFLWKNPQKVGLYTIAIEIISYRNGVKIDATIRDMSFNIQSFTSTQIVDFQYFVKVYPNPVYTEGYLEVSRDFGTNVWLTITSMNGQVVRTQNLKDGYTTKIQKGDLTKGTYIVHLNSEKYSTQFKYLIQ